MPPILRFVVKRLLAGIVVVFLVASAKLDLKKSFMIPAMAARFSGVAKTYPSACSNVRSPGLRVFQQTYLDAGFCRAASSSGLRHLTGYPQ